MFTDLVGIPAAYLAPSGLLALTVLFILMGRLVPRSTLDEVREESHVWRDAYLKEVAAHAQTRAQLGESLEQGKLTNQILESARTKSVTEGS